MIAAALASALVLMVSYRLRPLPAPRTPAATPIPPATERVHTAPHRPRRVALPWRRPRPATAGEVATWCDDLARAARSGSTLPNAVRQVTPPTSCAPAVERVVHALDRGAPLRDALDQASSTSPHVDLAIVVLRACADNGGPPSEPIDRAAAALRAREADAADRRTQSAQARLSAVVMTILPGAMLGLLLVTSAAVRHVVVSSVGLGLVATGAVLNLLGWRWMSAIVSRPMVAGRARHGRSAAVDALPDLVELLIVGVRAGCSPTAALGVAGEHAHPSLRPALADVDHLLLRGHRLADALQALPATLGPAAAGFADALATADRYGLPIEPVLDRLAADVRTERRRANERRARTLPVRLAFPLVLCTLPSFVLLAIVPALLGTLSTLQDRTP